MGFEKLSRRPLYSPGLQIAPSSGTAGDPSRLTGQFALPVENVTLAAADASLSSLGASFVTLGSSGTGRDAVLADPAVAGALKYIFVINNTTSTDLRIHTASTANTFWGTTFNTAALSTASTGSPGGTPGGTVALALVAASTTQWALMPGTTFNWDLSASTGSTSIA